MSDQFVISAALVEQLLRSGARATVPLQLAAALPNAHLQTMAVPPAGQHLLEYPVEVERDAPTGWWRLGDAGLLAEAYGLFSPVVISTGSATPPLYVLHGYYLFAAPPFSVGAAGALDAPVGARADSAVHFGAGGGATVSYFPFEGGEAYDFGGGFSFAGSQDFTWELWLRTTQSPGSALRILEQESSGVFPFRLQLLPSGLVRASRSDGTSSPSLDSGQVVNDGDWHYVTYSKAAGALSLQVDRNPPTTTADTVTGDTSLTVDGQFAGDGLDADWDEPAVYRHALADSAKLRHWNAAKGIAA